MFYRRGYFTHLHSSKRLRVTSFASVVKLPIALPEISIFAETTSHESPDIPAVRFRVPDILQ